MRFHGRSTEARAAGLIPAQGCPSLWLKREASLRQCGNQVSKPLVPLLSALALSCHVMSMEPVHGWLQHKQDAASCSERDATCMAQSVTGPLQAVLSCSPESAPVSCRADEGGSMDSCLFGLVRLIFTMEDSACRTRGCMLVRWYDAVEYDEHDKHLSSSMHKLQWATMWVDSQQRVPW